jgi:hypothetical protein
MTDELYNELTVLQCHSQNDMFVPGSSNALDVGLVHDEKRSSLQQSDSAKP